MIGKYHQVPLQYNSHGENLYPLFGAKDNYRYAKFFPILPFWGEWTVSHRHDGKITHLEPMENVFDFVIQDDEKRHTISKENRRLLLLQ